MKQKIIFTSIFALALSSQLVSAGSITDTYTTGDTLTATTLNNIKTAVNDNDSNVSINSSNIAINQADISANTSAIGNINTSHITALSASGTDAGIPSPASTPVFLRSLGSFTKNSDTSQLMVYYTDLLQASAVGMHCAILVYIDGVASNGSVVGLKQPLIKSSSLDSFTLTAVGAFIGLTSGTHTVDLYYRNLGTGTCLRNGGNWASEVTIVEM